MLLIGVCQPGSPRIERAWRYGGEYDGTGSCGMERMGNNWTAVFDILAGSVLLAFTLLGRLRPQWMLKPGARPTPERLAALDRRLTDRWRVEDYLRRGDTLRAVKEYVYVSQTGATLREGGRAVEAMASTMNIRRKPRPTGVILSIAAWALPLLLIALGALALLQPG